MHYGAQPEAGPRPGPGAALVVPGPSSAPGPGLFRTQFFSEAGRHFELYADDFGRSIGRFGVGRCPPKVIIAEYVGQISAAKKTPPPLPKQSICTPLAVPGDSSPLDRTNYLNAIVHSGNSEA